MKFKTNGYIELKNLNYILFRTSPFRAKIYAIVAMLVSVSYFIVYGIILDASIYTVIGLVLLVIVFIILPSVILGSLAIVKRKIRNEKNTDKLYFETYFTNDEVHLVTDKKELVFSYQDLFKYSIVSDILFINAKGYAIVPVFYKKLSGSDYDALLSLLDEIGIKKKIL